MALAVKSHGFVLAGRLYGLFDISIAGFDFFSVK